MIMQNTNVETTSTAKSKKSYQRPLTKAQPRKEIEYIPLFTAILYKLPNCTTRDYDHHTTRSLNGSMTRARLSKGQLRNHVAYQS